MRLIPAILIILVIAGCAASPREADRSPADSDGNGRCSSGQTIEQPVVGDDKWVDDGTPKFAPDPSEPITVDFVDGRPMLRGRNPGSGLERMPFGDGLFGPWDAGSLGDVLRDMGQRAGLQVIIEGDVDVKLTVMFRHIDAKAAIQSMCKANKLDYIEDGNVIIIKKRPKEFDLAHVVASPQLDGRFNVNFENHALIAAIMETANVTKTQVLIPALQRNAELPDEDQGGPIDEFPISLSLTDATPGVILRELARLGELDIEEIPTVDADGVSAVIYKFRYH